MDFPLLLVAAFVPCLGALLLLFLVVLKPKFDALPRDRRRPPSELADPTAISRLSQSAVNVVGDVIGESGGPYNRTVLYNAGVKMPPADFTVVVAVGSFLVAVFATLVTNIFIGLLLGAATPFLTRFILVILTDRRRGQFESQLIDTIQMVIGGLRVGHSVMRSIEAAAVESDVPTSEELSRIVNETRIGKDPRQAIEEASIRMDSEDFRWIGQAIQINREVGGDLAQVLEQVAGTIRERSEIKGQIRALSGEGKMSAYILMAMPVGVAIMISFINPGYMDVFIEEPIGIAMLIASFIMFAIGGFWMSRIIKIKF
ncbi:type II secretion system F family protein [Pseudarthrobacter sp. BIM B-2242]|uniref:type II secretion system F family protein n=1 Tax=Pseudarthrobacter sp. BIM B-2242 TaxID=2772401 RepID=UPI00168B86CC|nr:type II secretion system F family protein [Pseudarthrobacter sp. BIM B-2242]QOD02406.1 type II secretion system F family protein [Pseudarthrobacter sp. BIM B-2242]